MYSSGVWLLRNGLKLDNFVEKKGKYYSFSALDRHWNENGRCFVCLYDDDEDRFERDFDLDIVSKIDD